MNYRNRRLHGGGEFAFLVLVVLFCFVLIAALMWGLPKYNVWKSKLTGQAELNRATMTRQIQVEQAKAEVESAKMRAQAIREVGQACKDFPEYREAEFIREFGEALSSDKIEQIIYVPTERNIPIVESARSLH